mgnify:CR=1 FL=1
MIDLGISVPTAKRWLSLLETGHQVYLLYPYFRNIGKRIIKSPKLYFTDAGLPCSLLGIHDAAQVRDHYLRGSLFENLVVMEVLKHRWHRGLEPACVAVCPEQAIVAGHVEHVAGRTGDRIAVARANEGAAPEADAAIVEHVGVVVDERAVHQLLGDGDRDQGNHGPADRLRSRAA